MYVDICKVHGKYKRVLLRENYRQDGKVKHRTIGSLTRCSPEEIDAIKTALKYKTRISEINRIIEAYPKGGSALKRHIEKKFLKRSTLEIVKERGYLRAGIKENVPYFGFRDQTGNHVGFDVDIAKEIAGRIKIGLKIIKVSNTTCVPFLQEGRIDFISAAMTHYRKRDSVADFSVGYFYSPQTILIRKGTNINAIADLYGRSVGFAKGAGAIEYFINVHNGVNIQIFKNYKIAFSALKRGIIDGIAADFILLKGLLDQIPNPQEYLILPKENFFGGGYYAIGIKKNDSDWRNIINCCLQDIWLDKTWELIFNKWFGSETRLKINLEELGFQMVINH